MSISFQTHHDYSVVVASLCGALVWVMSQKNFNPKRQPFYFTVSFIMGIIGADVTLEVIKIVLPGVLGDERAIGAFFCSALIIQLTGVLTARLTPPPEK